MGLFFKKKKTDDIAVIFVKNRHREGYSYMNGIISVDGKKSRHRFYQKGMPACYVQPGCRELKVSAVWQKLEDKKLKDCLVGTATLEVEVEAGKFYALNYNVHEEYFEFLECDPENYMLD